MTFETGTLTDQADIGGGEKICECHAILTAITFEDGLKVGRFCKLDSGSIDNFDGSATPLVAGIVQRNVTDAVENDGLLKAATNTKIQYIRHCFATVDVKAGESPSQFGRVYASNDGDANDGLATADNSDVNVNAEFIKEIKTNVWLIYVTPAPEDLAMHIADQIGAHPASAISLLDSAGLTAQIEVEAAIAEILVNTPALIADPGNGGAIPVVRAGNCALAGGGSFRTLADPSAVGVTLDLSGDDLDLGSIDVDFASVFDQAGHVTIRLTVAGQFVRVQATQIGSALKWRLIANDGATLAF